MLPPLCEPGQLVLRQPYRGGNPISLIPQLKELGLRRVATCQEAAATECWNQNTDLALFDSKARASILLIYEAGGR